MIKRKSTSKEEVIAAGIMITLCFTVIVGVVLAFLGAIWWLWCSVLGFFWPSGPAQLIDPPFWYFVGGWTLLSMVTGLFKSKKGK